MMLSFKQAGPTNIEDAKKAPNSPGLYVWHAMFQVGRADWHEHFAGNSDKAKKNLYTALTTHSQKFIKQDLSVQATANFSTRWSGKLQEDSGNRWRDLDLDSQTCNIEDPLIKACSSNETREGLINLVKAGFPVWSSPLYIGVATDQSLRERLIQHSNGFMKLWIKTSKSVGALEHEIQPTNFAERAFLSGFHPEDLYFYTLEAVQDPDEILDKEKLKNIILSAEFLLNRWSTPILGRR